MPSLHRHLQLHGPQHDRLAFRPDCLICLPRLSGRYPDPRLLSRGGEATLATGLVLAGSLLPVAGASAGNDSPPTFATPPAVLAEPDDQGDGDARDGGRDQGPPIADGGEGSAPPAPQGPARSPEVEVEPPQSPESSPDSSPAASSSSEGGSPGAGESSPGTPGRGSGAPSPGSPAADRGSRPRHPAEGGGSASPPSGTPGTSRDASDREGPGQRSAGARRDPASDPSRGSGRRVVVQPGDCLWLIAERALGSDANDEQIAAAVDRLWQRNADRIATGDPDLIHPGQTLDLP